MKYEKRGTTARWSRLCNVRVPSAPYVFLNISSWPPCSTEMSTLQIVQNAWYIPLSNFLIHGNCWLCSVLNFWEHFLVFFCLYSAIPVRRCRCSTARQRTSIQPQAQWQLAQQSIHRDRGRPARPAGLVRSELPVGICIHDSSPYTTHVACYSCCIVRANACACDHTMFAEASRQYSRSISVSNRWYYGSCKNIVISGGLVWRS